ncbi:MAG TPA: FAD-dependent oxidoreductase [Candidatus Sulfomarinibacteraceae bacterium]|nr:FAD-dependent oxidoreductase [Candidatus Sulfomarinibacteraceae bacterium]
MTQNNNNTEQTAFPRLSPEQIEELGAYAQRRTFEDGQTLFEAGESDFKFFIIIEGTVEILEPSSGRPHTVTVHQAGEFTGDIDMLTGRPSLLTAVARGEVLVYQLAAEELRRILSEEPRLGEEILRAFLARRELLEASDFVGVLVIGSRHSRDTLRIRDFLSKNQVPLTWIDVENDPRVHQLFRHFNISAEDTPVVVVQGNRGILRRPSNRELGEALNIKQPVEHVVYDLTIIGAGPAGLAAAVYGASEGLQTVVVEKDAPGGQASQSSRIENYMGFPAGLSGSDLANRAVLQAQKFGALITTPVEAVGLTCERGYNVVQLDDEDYVVTRCVLIATGGSYRRLDVENCAHFEGAGVYYGATTVEAQMCHDQDVVIVGAGNSAGQAAVFLSQHARRVLLAIRGEDIYKDMSSYLARRIEETDNIDVHLTSEVVALEGKESLERAVLRNRETGEEMPVETAALFIFIGVEPHTAWLPPQIELDERGFIKTGPDVQRSPHWPLRRPPFLLETSQPGVFAAGDARAGSIKRVASAVGEGSMTVHFVHRYLSG